MTIVVPNAGEAKILENSVNKTAPQDLVLKLFANNVTPAETDAAAAFTEAAGGGYASKALAGATWNAATPGDPSYIDYAQQVWTFTGPLTTNPAVYGYFVVGSVDGVIRWAERFSDGPYTPNNNGDQVKVTPKIEAS